MLALRLAALWGLPAFLFLAACSDPGAPTFRVSVEVAGGNTQFAAPGGALEAPLKVVVEYDGGGPASGQLIRWRVITGSGAALDPVEEYSDADGIASSRVTLGQDIGLYVIEASAGNLAGDPALFEAYAVLPPNLGAVSPSSAAAGDTVTINGTGFSPEPSHNRVLFGSVRGFVVSATASELRVVVPPCLPSRSIAVTVRLGGVSSNSTSLQVLGDDGITLSLKRGEVVTLVSTDDLSCVRLGAEPGSEYVVVPQNVARVAGYQMPYQLLGLAGVEPVPAEAMLVQPGAAESTPLLELRRWLRDMEARILPEDLIRRAAGDLGIFGIASLPAVGSQRQFSVLNKDRQFSQVTAEVKHVSNRAIIYQDLDAPAGGFSHADFTRFGQMFDDPIYETVVGAYGAPSDVDGNERVIILFTPVVNAMTGADSQGYIAGFFYGLDLTTQPGSNQAEVFYSIVPDPDGRFGVSRSRQQILRVVPPVLAHELQHMIHFNKRYFINQVGPETHWLSEALAHMAEDLVGREFLARGDADNAEEFRRGNHSRAARYLADPGRSSVTATDPPGSLEERGAQWLLLKYLMGHYGDLDLLGRLTRSTRTGVDNITAEVERVWGHIISEWSVAIWVDADVALTGDVDSIFTFPNLDLRSALGRFPGGFPLDDAPRFGFEDFTSSTTLMGSSKEYLVIAVPDTAVSGSMGVVMSGPDGDGFPAFTRPRLSIVRVR